MYYSDRVDCIFRYWHLLTLEVYLINFSMKILKGQSILGSFYFVKSKYET